MNVLLGLVFWLVASVAIAQDRPPYEPGAELTAPPAPPRVGSCVGGNCAGPPTPRGLAVPRPRRAARGAHGAAIFGSVTSGLVLGGALAIAIADHRESERITRGVWLCTLAVSPPIVAFTSFLARRQRGSRGVLSARRLGWVAYGAALTNGVLQWHGAFRDEPPSRALTIVGGVTGSIALLAHALDALVSGRSARTHVPRVSLAPTGIDLRF